MVVSTMILSVGFNIALFFSCAHAFSIPTSSTTTCLVCQTDSSILTWKSFTHRKKYLSVVVPCAKSNKDNEEEDYESDSSDERTGMPEAFKSLEALTFLDFEDPSTTGDSSSSTMSNSNASKKPLSAEEIKDVLRQASQNNSFSRDITTSEGLNELKLYSDMYKEMEENDEEGASIYGDILGEMIDGDDSSDTTNSSSSDTRKGFGKPMVINDADGIGSISDNSDVTEELRAVELSQDTDEFMRLALEEAMQEVGGSAKGGDQIAKEILNDEEIMKEINAIFEKANDELLKGVAEIKAEQQAMTNEMAKKRSDSLSDENKRLKEAEDSVEKLVAKVRKETLEVEDAVKNLQAVQAELAKDPVMRAASLKSGGILKQSALVGSILFSFRSLGDILMLSGPDGSSHLAPAIVQAVIAAICAAYLAFSSK